jgi:bacteriocin-like protein
MNKEKKTARTPGRKLTKEDLAHVIGGSELLNGCCTQGCCCDSGFENS